MLPRNAAKLIAAKINHNRRINAEVGSRAEGAIIPAACSRAAGRRLWREPAPGQPMSVANIGYWDLCEIGYKLAQGFLQYTDWRYQTFTGGTSWVTERAWYRADGLDQAHHDQELQRDLVAAADIVHVNEHHEQALLADVQPGKRMVMHHHGTAFRGAPYAHEQQEVDAGYLRLVSTPDLLIYGNHRDSLQWLPSPLEIAELDRTYPRWQEAAADAPLVIGHSYTVGNNKGSGDFIRIVDALVKGHKLNLELGLIHHVQRRQALWHISQCDVYFATFLFGPGLASYEAMAFRKPVLVGCTKDELAAQRSVIGEELPFIHVTPETCGKVIRDLANDPAMRREWGERGRRYVEKFHDTPVVVEKLKAMYEQVQPCKAVVKA